MLTEFPFVWKFLRRAEGQSFLPFPFAFEFFFANEAANLALEKE